MVVGSVLVNIVSMADKADAVVVVEDEDVGADFQSEKVDWDDEGGEEV